MWKPRPSAIRLKPTISRKLRHNTTTVGWALTKRVSGLDASTITAIEITTAAIITPSCSTMPTAVITASSENTASSTTICATTAPKLAYSRLPVWTWTLPSTRSCSSVVALNSRNRPPNSRIRSRPENGCEAMWNSGSVRVTSQDMTDSKPRRMTIARLKPISLALSRCSGASLSARIAMNIRLSIPSTISSTISANKPTQMFGSNSHSMPCLPELRGGHCNRFRR